MIYETWGYCPVCSRETCVMIERPYCSQECRRRADGQRHRAQKVEWTREMFGVPPPVGKVCSHPHRQYEIEDGYVGRIPYRRFYVTCRSCPAEAMSIRGFPELGPWILEKGTNDGE